MKNVMCDSFYTGVIFKATYLNSQRSGKEFPQLPVLGFPGKVKMYLFSNFKAPENAPTHSKV